MSHNSYELRQQEIMDVAGMDMIKLKGSRYFSKYDLESLEEKISDLKTSRYYIGAACMVIGSFITIIVLHYT